MQGEEVATAPVAAGAGSPGGPSDTPPEQTGALVSEGGLDAKYREQLRAAYRLLVESTGTVARLDELCWKPGAAPLRDLLEGPCSEQLRDIETAQEALTVLTLFCQQAGFDPDGDGGEAW